MTTILPFQVGQPPRRFHYWLRHQLGRDDRVGDLAHDVDHDSERPAFRSLAEWWLYLDHHGAIEQAFHTLIIAWREFAQETSSRPRDRRPPRSLGCARKLTELPGRPGGYFGTEVDDSPACEPRRKRFARSIPLGVRARVMERDGFKCRRCGHGPPDRKIEVDHITPVALGGDVSEANLQTLCDWCNIGKADRPPHPHDLGGGR